jgi:hypothetical protein
MRRTRRIPPTASSVRKLATRRGYLLTKEGQQPRRYKLFDLSGRRAAPVASKDAKHRYSWRLADVDHWLRQQPLLRDLQ